MYLYDFVIVFALEEEFEQFKHALCVYRNKKGDLDRYKKLTEIDEVLIIQNKKFKIYATTLTKQGMVYAGICATKLIEKYRPKHIVILGIAGGYGQEFGSVLIADFVFPFQQGKFKGNKNFPDGIGIPLIDELKIFNHHKNEIIEKVIQTVSVMRMEKRNVSKITAEIGPIASSIQVIASKKVKVYIQGLIRQVIGIEMEGYSIFLAASETDPEFKPNPILIKSVCDHADQNKGNKYRELAGFTSAYFFLKCLELEEIQPLKDLPDKSYIETIPYSYLKQTNSPNKNKYQEIIKNAPKKSVIRFIAITSERDFALPTNSITDKKYLIEAFKNGVTFQGVVVNPSRIEAKYRNKFESPQMKPPILNAGARQVKDALKGQWKNHKIELKYAPIGVEFKLWLSDKAAMIEPYHLGRENPDDKGGLCGFTQIFYSLKDREYKILKNHFENVWKISKRFWPPSDTETMTHKKTIK
jgi:nucleoside phosphorylase